MIRLIIYVLHIDQKVNYYKRQAVSKRYNCCIISEDIFWQIFGNLEKWVNIEKLKMNFVVLIKKN